MSYFRQNDPQLDEDGPEGEDCPVCGKATIGASGEFVFSANGFYCSADCEEADTEAAAEAQVERLLDDRKAAGPPAGWEP